MYTSAKGIQKKISIGFLAAICAVFLIAYYGIRRINSTPPGTIDNTSLTKNINKSENLGIGSPVRVIIPKITVDAVLEYVGLNSEGEMEEPTEPGNAAWFNRRPLPGEEGTSVIAGHFGLKDDKPAVFDNLSELKEGDEVQVLDSKGLVSIFLVKELRTYTPKQDASEVFSSNDGKSHLNLITCKGAWNHLLQSYDARLVVFAEKTIP